MKEGTVGVQIRLVPDAEGVPAHWVMISPQTEDVLAMGPPKSYASIMSLCHFAQAATALIDSDVLVKWLTGHDMAGNPIMSPERAQILRR